LKVSFALIFLLFLVLSINVVYAADIDLTDFDDKLGDALGIPAFGGGLLATMLLLFIVLGCLGAAMKRAPSAMITMTMIVVVCSFAIICGWFPTWTLIMICLMVALFFGNKIIGALR